MTGEDALKLVKLFERNQIELPLDGGLEVAAMPGEQTRIHSDVDIVIMNKDVTSERSLQEVNQDKPSAVNIPSYKMRMYNK
jgi:Aminoglycoside-2''-adenylyltransferase